MTCAVGCSTVEELIVRAARILNDYASDGTNVRWLKGELIDYLNEGLCEEQGLRPDIFADTVTLTLQPGSTQKVPEEYASVTGISRNLTSDPGGHTTEGSRISRSDDRFAALFKKKPCLAHSRAPCAPDDKLAKPYEVSTFVPNFIDDGVFDVTPPVPDGTTKQVQATVVRFPPKHSANAVGAKSGVDCEFEPQLVDWMVGRALQKDVESQASVVASAQHMKAFYDAFALKYLTLQRFSSGYYAGQMPPPATSDPQFRQR